MKFVVYMVISLGCCVLLYPMLANLGIVDNTEIEMDEIRVLDLILDPMTISIALIFGYPITILTVVLYVGFFAEYLWNEVKVFYRRMKKNNS